MRSDTNVRALDLSNNKLSDVIGGSLGKMIEKNKRLLSLNLGFNELAHQSLGAIGRALKINSVLTTVVLESNPIMVFHREHAGSDSSAGATTNGPSGPLGNIEAFTSSIASNSSLTALNVFSTQMSYEAGRALAQAFGKNLSIVSLEVGGNSLHQGDIALFASHLKKNQARMEVAESKAELIQSEMKAGAEVVHLEQKKLAKQREDAEWHDANAKQRAQVREQEEWERARVKAEGDVRRLVEIEAIAKKYREQLEAEKKPKGAKGKK